MKKRKKLKNWVVKVLAGVIILSILSLGLETSNTLLFLASKLFALGTIVLCTRILSKYSRVFEEEIGRLGNTGKAKSSHLHF